MYMYTSISTLFTNFDELEIYMNKKGMKKKL